MPNGRGFTRPTITLPRKASPQTEGVRTKQRERFAVQKVFIVEHLPKGYKLSFSVRDRYDIARRDVMLSDRRAEARRSEHAQRLPGVDRWLTDPLGRQLATTGRCRKPIRLAAPPRHEGIILFTSNFAGWDSGLPVEIKVRAEFKKNLDCSGPTIADIWEVNKKVRGPHAILLSELTGSPYRVSGPR